MLLSSPDLFVHSGSVRFPVTVIERNAFDLEADGFRGATLFRAKINY